MKNIIFNVGKPILNTVWVELRTYSKYFIKSVSDKIILEYPEFGYPYKLEEFLKKFVPFEQWIFQSKYKDKHVPHINEEWISPCEQTSIIKIINTITVYGEDFIIYQFKEERFPNDLERKFYIELDRFMENFKKVE